MKNTNAVNTYGIAVILAHGLKRIELPPMTLEQAESNASKMRLLSPSADICTINLESF